VHLKKPPIEYNRVRVFIEKLREIYFYKVQILTVDAAVHAENLAYNYSSLAPSFDQNLSIGLDKYDSNKK
jgi:hypothetical protein